MSTNDLAYFYHTHKGKVSDKWSSFMVEYDRLFRDIRQSEVCLLEIGVQNGGSLEIWSKYFKQAKSIVGCDVSLACGKLQYEDPRISIVVGNACLETTEKTITSLNNVFHIIIDDGSHKSSDIFSAFARYFPHLENDGYYIVEDIHCSYWAEFEGGLYVQYSAISFFKLLADIINYEHWGIPRERHDLLLGFTRRYGVAIAEDLLSQIYSVEFINSMCIVRKRMAKLNHLGSRVVAGEEEVVELNVKMHRGKEIAPLIQAHDDRAFDAYQLEKHDHQTTSFSNDLTGSSHVLGVNQATAMLEFANKISELKRVVTERDDQIKILNRRVTEAEQAMICNDEQISLLNQIKSERDSLINTLRSKENCQAQLIDELKLQLVNLENQRKILDEQLFKLNAESATYGAKIGRKITHFRTLLAPLGTKRSTLVTLGGKFASKLISVGLIETLKVVYRYLSYEIRSKTYKAIGLRKNDSTVHGDINDSFEQVTNSKKLKIQTDHPQLAEWISGNEPSQTDLQMQLLDAKKFRYEPLISVLIPIYKVPREVLLKTLNSLIGQTYTNWEACFVWSDSMDLKGWKWFQQAIKTDGRFKSRYLSVNGGISKNTNVALELAEGEFLALLDHDDALAPWAFYEVVKLLQASPHLDFIYSDKDSIDAEGNIRLNALFKPEWSPEMMHSVNYLTHLNVFRASLMREIGSWNSETDGAQDWDIFFRITEKTKNIARIPSVLYHWRILPTSTAMGLKAKPYAAMGQIRAQQNHLKRMGLSAAVVPTPEGLFHIKWSTKPSSADAIICQTGSVANIVTVLDSLRAVKHEILRKIYVYHDAPLIDELIAFKCVWGKNIIFKQCEVVNWHVALVDASENFENQSILLLDGCISGMSSDLPEELLNWVGEHPDIAWTSAIAMNPDGTVYESGRVVAKNYQSAPMFQGSSLSSFGWFGGPLWYRNARAASPYSVAMRARDLLPALSRLNISDDYKSGFTRLCMALAENGQRGLINPFARSYYNQPPESDWPNDGRLYHEDPYFNPAFDQVSPLKLRS